MNAKTIKMYYGFAKKSGSVIYGADKVCEAKRLYLVLVSSELAQNSLNKVTRKCQNINAPLAVLPKDQFIIVEDNPSVKCMGIKNAELAKAMQKE